MEFLQLGTLLTAVIGYGVMIAVAVALIRFLNALTRKFDREGK